MELSSRSLVFSRDCEGVLGQVAYESPDQVLFCDLMYFVDSFKDCGDSRSSYKLMQSFVEARDKWELAADHLHLRGAAADRLWLLAVVK